MVNEEKLRAMIKDWRLAADGAEGRPIRPDAPKPKPPGYYVAVIMRSCADQLEAQLDGKGDFARYSVDFSSKR